MIAELSQSLPFRLKFKYKFVRGGHISVNEARVYKTWIKSVAERSSSCLVGLSRVLAGCLAYVIRSGVFPGLLHWLSELMESDCRGFDVVTEAGALKKRGTRGQITVLGPGMEAGFTGTVQKMRKALGAFSTWLEEHAGTTLERAAEFGLRGFGLCLFAADVPLFAGLCHYWSAELLPFFPQPA